MAAPRLPLERAFAFIDKLYELVCTENISDVLSADEFIQLRR
jgi:hypothetical protein